ncbi:unnamed protein product [Calicophoron daubneyi]|uniref:Cep192-like domain-containing protein n=1 Tax=Calicophoron daubneyi TaxID=300641 RepID=A0AAV2SYB1_CALDB
MTTSILLGSSGQQNEVFSYESDLVEPDYCLKPPNHLLDTNIFSRLNANAFIKVDPPELHFSTSVRKEKSGKVFRLINIAQCITRINIIPPDTPYFTLKYDAPKTFAPGSSILCSVVFKPLEGRYYEDCVRVHTEENDNHLVIPLYGYPTIGNLVFPKFIRFPAVPLGKSKIHIIPLRSSANVDFEFSITKIFDHPSFNVTPLNGVLYAKKTLNIRVKFTPVDYTTCRLDLELNVAQLNFNPKRCSIVGHSEPGMESLAIKNKCAQILDISDPLDAGAFDRCARGTANKLGTRVPERLEKIRKKKGASKESGLQQDAVPEINCPHHVAKFLVNTDAAVSVSGSKLSSRQRKLLAFESAVRQDEREEQRNQVRWQPKLGQQPVTEEEIQKLQNDWASSWRSYLIKCSDPESAVLKTFEPMEIRRPQKVDESSLSFVQPRPHRPFHTLASLQGYKPTFRTQLLQKAGFSKRTHLLNRFRSFVSRIIIQQRIDRRLKRMRKFGMKLQQQDNEDSANAGCETPNDLLEEIGDSLPSVSQECCGLRVNSCWTDRKLVQTSLDYGLDGISSATVTATEAKLRQDAINALECTAAFSTHAQSWPMFEITQPWKWQEFGCQKFDSIEAQELAYWALESEELDITPIYSSLEENILSGAAAEKQGENAARMLVSIHPTDPRYSVGDAMQLPSSVLRLPDLGTEIRGTALTRCAYSCVAPPIKHNLMDEYLSEYVSSFPLATSSHTDNMDQAKILDKLLCTLIRTIRASDAGRLLEFFTESSPEYQPFVLLPSSKDFASSASVCGEDQEQQLESEVNGAKQLLLDTIGSKDVDPSYISNKMEEWIQNFPELEPLLRPWILRTDDELKQQQQQQQRQILTLDCSIRNPLTLVTEALRSIPEEDVVTVDGSQLLQTAKAWEEEILAFGDNTKM